MALLFFGFARAKATAQTQSPANSTAPTPIRSVSAQITAHTYGDLAQVMRGIMLPNSNVVFLAQGTNPASVKPAASPEDSTDPLTGTYGGWAAVENSSLAIAEATNLIIIPGRLCSNGRPAPVHNADFMKFVQGLRDAALESYKAAQSKNQDKIVDAAGDLTNACSNCHTKYRPDEPGGSIANRCK
jgi:hypothetical protein